MIPQCKQNKTQNITTIGEDLNNYKKNGTYFFKSNFTPLNIPSGSNGILEIISGSQCIKQIWYRFGTANNNDYQTFIRMFDITKNTWSNWRQFAIIPQRQEFTIESDNFEMNGGTIRNSYLQNGNIVTVFLCVKTTTALTANTSYEISTNLPNSPVYMGAVGIFQSTFTPASIFMTSVNGKIRITPSANIASGKEFNAQFTYFTS